MDITLVDVTDVSAAAPGDEVVLWDGKPAESGGVGQREEAYASTLETRSARVDDEGPVSGAESGRQGAPTSVEEFAAWADTIPHEILSRLGSRVPRRLRHPS